MDGRRPDQTLNDTERQAIQGIEREIRDVLSATPSPQFLARVRQRTAGGVVSARRWVPWSVAVGVAVVILAVVTALRLGPSPAGSRQAVVQIPAVAASPGDDMGPPAVGPHPSSVADGLRGVTGVRATPTRRRTEPEVLVPSGQMEAIRRFVEILRASPIDAQPLPEIAEVVPSPLRLSEIEITPLKIGPLTWGGNPGQPEMRDRNQ